MSVLVIYNPVSGDSTAEAFFNTHVVPRLHAAGLPTEVVRTSAPGDAGVKALDFSNRHGGDLTIVLGSGDGTLQEIANQLAPHANAVRFALVPCGTANALYAYLFGPPLLHDPVAYKLRSLEAFLRSSTPRQLRVSFTSLHGPPILDHGHRNPHPIASIVVASTALHAAILRDSEKLRQQIPGIERFGVAAQQNVTKWYTSRVKLLPMPSSGVIHVYDPHKGNFVPASDASESGSPLDVHGPFAYFLSTVNVDRLEPQFRVVPTISKHPPTDTSMDVVMIRPQRDPTVTLDTPQARLRFAEKLFAVVTTAYKDGNHINLRYTENGDITENGSGNTAVECFRCGGWEWIPDEADEDAHLLCADGALFEIEKGGRATCVAHSDVTPQNFHIHV